MLKQYIFILISLALGAGSLNAQNAKLTGTISEDVEGVAQAVPFANVAILESMQGTTTDFDGNYTINNIIPGQYTMVVSFMGYKADTIRVDFESGESKKQNVAMVKNMQLLKEFEVEAKVNRESANILLLEQKNASEIKQSIGAQELSNKGVSDVADGLTKVTGITMVEGRDLFVRGLGDRYNMATFNGGLIASPNPDLKVIPLDLIPTDIVQSISIDKVYMPRYFADYAGARIDIVSKDYPEKPFLKAELNTSINSRTTFKDFRNRPDGKKEFLGYDGTNRDMPAVIEKYGKNNGYETSKIEDQDYPYTTGLNQTNRQAMPTTGLLIAQGNYKDLGSKSGLGFSVVGSFDNKYQTKEGVDRVLKKDRAANTDYTYTAHEYTTNTTLYGNLFYKINRTNSVSYNVLFINSSENNSTTHEGFNNDQGYDLITVRNPFFQDQMMNHQMVGKHLFGDQDKLAVNWNASYSKATNKEKDRIQNVWLDLEDDNNYYYNTLDVASNHRFWSGLEENQVNVNGEVAYKFNYLSKSNDNSNQGRVYGGASFLSKARDYDWRQVNYRIDNTLNSDNPFGQVADPLNPDNELNQKNYEEGWYDFKEQKDPSSKYFASLDIVGAYANFDYYLVPSRFQLQLGVRVEQSTQTIRYKTLSDLYAGPYRENTLDTINLFPVLGGKLVINNESNLRFSFSQTTSRPMFREFAPIQYLPYFGGIQEEGNANLKNGYSYNGDLKYELFPEIGEKFTFTVFGKYLYNPIERIRMEAATPLATYINTDNAVAAGFEVEYTKNFGNLIKADSGWTRNIFVGANFSWLYSRIIIDTTDKSKGTINVTNLDRPLQGASPFLANADITYRLNWNERTNQTDFTLSYNVFGKRITDAGILGIPDTYEMSVNTVDFILRNRLGKNFSLDLKVMNILDPEIRKEQSFVDGNEVVNSYQRGVAFALKLGYSF
ncbi:MAG: carboxypeptidase-like regulatory domain-containing protein [Flavobacteriales bacterium]|nr:carboxypeptidase-like regulatory domain-containing protein [Flavobacteriales bacterium]